MEKSERETIEQLLDLILLETTTLAFETLRKDCPHHPDPIRRGFEVLKESFEYQFKIFDYHRIEATKDFLDKKARDNLNSSSLS